jgi:hypothetical protein
MNLKIQELRNMFETCLKTSTKAYGVQLVVYIMTDKI